MSKLDKFKTGKYANAIKQGYRSGLEVDICRRFAAMGVPFEYEKEKWNYTVPESSHTYTVDLRLPKINKSFMYLELKGYLDLASRKKYAQIQRCNPTKDLRFVFSNPNTPIRKGSKTTYAMWAEQLGFPWCGAKYIPDEWIKEIELTTYLT